MTWHGAIILPPILNPEIPFFLFQIHILSLLTCGTISKASISIN